jgi:hypothetical protein
MLQQCLWVPSLVVLHFVAVANDLKTHLRGTVRTKAFMLTTVLCLHAMLPLLNNDDCRYFQGVLRVERSNWTECYVIIQGQVFDLTMYIMNIVYVCIQDSTMYMCSAMFVYTLRAALQYTARVAV